MVESISRTVQLVIIICKMLTIKSWQCNSSVMQWMQYVYILGARRAHFRYVGGPIGFKPFMYGNGDPSN